MGSNISGNNCAYLHIRTVWGARIHPLATSQEQELQSQGNSLSGWHFPGYFPRLPGVPGCTLLLSAVIWKQVPPVMLQDCYFHLFLSKERENIQSLFKCAALASGVGVT